MMFQIVWWGLAYTLLCEVAEVDYQALPHLIPQELSRKDSTTGYEESNALHIQPPNFGFGMEIA